MLRQSLPLTLGYTVEVAPTFAGLGGALDALGAHRVIVLTNPTVRDHHGCRLAAEVGTRISHWHEMPDGEEYKNLDEWGRLVGAVLDGRPDRTTHVLAFGGGVVGDLAGFVAAATLRGLPVVQVPTTLLAMVDSSVGGKTAVNTPQGKNLVGAFHHPRLVWAALDTLRTLPPREVTCGLGEIVKHAVIDGPEAFAALESAAPALARGERLGEQVVASVAVKARIVEEDPSEQGVRALLNLGHTLGHAIEAVAGYGTLTHGEAVAIGLLAIVRLAAERGEACSDFLARLEALYRVLGLRDALPSGVDSGALVHAMGFDKKRERGMVRLVIATAPGSLHLRTVDDAELARLPELVRSAE